MEWHASEASFSRRPRRAANFCALGGGCWAYGVASILDQCLSASGSFFLFVCASSSCTHTGTHGRTRSKDKKKPIRLSKWSYCIVLPDLLSLSNALFLHHQESIAHIDLLICKIRSSILVVTNKTDGRVN